MGGPEFLKAQAAGCTLAEVVVNEGVRSIKYYKNRAFVSWLEVPGSYYTGGGCGT